MPGTFNVDDYLKEKGINIPTNDTPKVEAKSSSGAFDVDGYLKEKGISVPQKRTSPLNIDFGDSESEGITQVKRRNLENELAVEQGKETIKETIPTGIKAVTVQADTFYTPDGAEIKDIPKVQQFAKDNQEKLVTDWKTANEIVKRRDRRSAAMLKNEYVKNGLLIPEYIMNMQERIKRAKGEDFNRNDPDVQAAIKREYSSSGDRGFLGNLGASFQRGIESAGGEVIGGVGKLIDVDSMGAAGDSLADYANLKNQYDPVKGDNWFSDIIHQTAGMAGPMAIGIAANAIVPGSGNALWAAQGGGAMMNEADKAGIDRSVSLPFALVGGILYAKVENMQAGQILGKNQATLLKSAIAQALRKQLNKATRNSLVKAGVKVGGNILMESAEEGIQEVVSLASVDTMKLVNDIVNGTDLADNIDAKQQLKQSVDAFIDSLGPMGLMSLAGHGSRHGMRLNNVIKYNKQKGLNNQQAQGEVDNEVSPVEPQPVEPAPVRSFRTPMQRLEELFPLPDDQLAQLVEVETGERGWTDNDGNLHAYTRNEMLYALTGISEDDINSYAGEQQAAEAAAKEVDNNDLIAAAQLIADSQGKPIDDILYSDMSDEQIFAEADKIEQSMIPQDAPQSREAVQEASLPENMEPDPELEDLYAEMDDLALERRIDELKQAETRGVISQTEMDELNSLTYEEDMRQPVDMESNEPVIDQGEITNDNETGTESIIENQDEPGSPEIPEAADSGDLQPVIPSRDTEPSAGESANMGGDTGRSDNADARNNDRGSVADVAPGTDSNGLELEPRADGGAEGGANTNESAVKPDFTKNVKGIEIPHFIENPDVEVKDGQSVIKSKIIARKNRNQDHYRLSFINDENGNSHIMVEKEKDLKGTLERVDMRFEEVPNSEVEKDNWLNKQSAEYFKQNQQDENQGDMFSGQQVKDNISRENQAAPELLKANIALQEAAAKYKLDLKLGDQDSEKAKEANAVTAVIGKKAYMYNGGPDDVGGFYYKDFIFLNENANYDTSDRIAGHEVMHILENEYPELYKRLKARLLPLIDKDILQSRVDKERSRRGNIEGVNTSDELMQNEIISDLFGAQMRNKDFWESMAKDDPSLLEKILQILKSIKRKILRAKKTGSLSQLEKKSLDVFGKNIGQAIKELTGFSREVISKEVAEKSAAVKKETESNKVKPDQVIEDFGEKIGGARKDYAQILSDAEKQDIEAVPLSKSWPEPNYKRLLDGGVDPWVVGFVRAAREEVPNKPRSRYQMTGYVSYVKNLRDMSQKLLSGEAGKDELQATLGKSSFSTMAERLNSKAGLYLELGHDTSLKGIRMEKAHFSIYRGEENVTKWIISKSGKSTAFGNWPRELAVGNSKEDVVKEFKSKINNGLLDKDTKKRVKFDLYSYRRDKPGYFIGKKIGRETVDLFKFDSSTEARDFLKNNYDEVVARLEAFKNIANERRSKNSPRIGTDYRKGKNVTPEMFQDAFGFRGVEFGNYVEQGKRQADLNEAYDGLMDLAGILNIPSRAISLNGELGLAFGARGKGGKDAPKAHYEPGKVVINLTKRSGAGSLAHEWWHALDFYFGNQIISGKGKGVATTDSLVVALASRKANYQPDGMRPEMIEAFGSLVRTIKGSGMPARSLELDRRRSKPYWSQIEEMTARAFGNYVVNRLAAMNAENDYLANIKDISEFAESMINAFFDGDKTAEDLYPYLTENEIESVVKSFDDLFKTLKTKETEGGKVALFSVADPVDSPEFKKWFGDSKVVDKDGNPKIMYHGTLGRRFNIFKGGPFFFSEDRAFAQDYADSKGFEQGIDDDVEVKEVYLKSEKLFDSQNEDDIKALGKILPDKISYGFARKMLTKEEFLDRLKGNLTLPPQWTKAQIENAKFGRVIGDDRNGFNNDIFIGVNKKNEVVYVSHYLYDVIRLINKKQKEDLLNGKDVKLEGYKLHGEIYDRESLTRAINDGKITDRELASVIFDKVNYKIVPYTSSQEKTYLKNQDNWTEFELNGVDLFDKIKSLGYDGIRIQEGGQKNIAVFSPTQIKSVNNQGTWDSTNPDIRFSVADPVDSPAFKKWFGDSKVVDESGKPLVVYHGTKSIFNSFSNDEVGRDRDEGLLGAGFYFTSDRDNAQNYANNASGNDSPTVMNVYLKLDNPYIWTKNIDSTKLPSKNQAQKIKNDLTKKGHDGVIYETDWGQTWYVAFSPEQIKLVDNTGTWDADNPDIRFSVNDKETSFQKWKSDNYPWAMAIEQHYPNGIKPSQKYGKREDITGSYINWKNGTPVDVVAKAMGVEEQQLVDVLNGLQKSKMREKFRIEHTQKDKLWRADDIEQTKQMLLDDQIVPGRDLLESYPELEGFVSELLTGKEDFTSKDIIAARVAAKSAPDADKAEMWGKYHLLQDIRMKRASAKGNPDRTNTARKIINDYANAFLTNAEKGKVLKYLAKENITNGMLYRALNEIEKLRGHQKHEASLKKQLDSLTRKYDRLLSESINNRGSISTHIDEMVNILKQLPDSPRKREANGILTKLQYIAKVPDDSVKWKKIPILDEYGNQMTNEYGKPAYEQDVDENGNPKLKKDGSPALKWDKVTLSRRDWLVKEAEKLLGKAIELSEMDKFVNLVDGILANAKRGLDSKGRPKAKLEEDVQRKVDRIRDAYRMTKDQVERVTDTLLDKDGEFLNDLAAERFVEIQMFSQIKSKGLENAYKAFEEIAGLVDDGRSMYWDHINAERARMDLLRIQAMNEISNGASGINKNEESKKIDSQRKGWGRRKEGLKNFLYKNQSIEFLFEALTAKNSKTAMLSSETGNYFMRKIHVATHEAVTEMDKKQEALTQALEGIFKGKGKDLRKKLMDFNKRVDDSGVFTYTTEIETSSMAVEKLQDYVEELEQEYSKNPNNRTKDLLAEHKFYLADALFNGDASVTIYDVVKTSNPVQEALTKDEALNHWLMWQQVDKRETMMIHGWTQDSIMQLEKFIGNEGMALGKWMQDQYRDEYQSINDVFQRMTQTQLPQIDNYAPAVFTDSKTGDDIQDMSINGFSGTGIMNVAPGALISRKRHMAEPKRVGALTMYLRHTAEMEHYKAWAEVIKEMRSVFLNKDVARFAKHFAGRGVYNTFMNRVNALANAGEANQHKMAALDALRQGAVLNALMYNTAVFSKQLISIPAYGMGSPNIPAISLAKYMFDFWKNPIDNYKELRESSPYIKNRLSHGFERDVIATLQNVRNRQDIVHKIEKWGMFPVKIGDIIPVISGGWAVYKYHLGNNLKKGMPEDIAKQEAVLEFERSTDRTQQAGHEKDLTTYQGMGSLYKFFTMYMTSPLQYAQLEVAAIQAYKNAKPDAKKHLAKTLVINHVILPVLFEGMSQFFRHGVDFEEWSIGDFLQTMFFGPLSSLWIAGKAGASVVGRLFTGNNYFTRYDAPLARLINDAGNVSDAIRSIFVNGPGSRKTRKALDNAVRSAGPLSRYARMYSVPRREIGRYGRMLDQRTDEQKKIDRSISRYKEDRYQLDRNKDDMRYSEYARKKESLMRRKQRLERRARKEGVDTDF